MADEVARLVAVMEANLKGFTKGMEQAQVIADRRLGAVESRLKRTEGAFAGAFKGNLASGLNLLATRFLGISAAIGVLNRIASEAAKTNDDVKASVERMNEAYARLGESAGPGIAFVNNRLADMLDAVNNVITGLKNAGTEFRTSPLFGGVGGTLRTKGIPFESAANPFAKIDPTTKNVIPGAAGFPVPGVTDVTPKKPPGGKTFAERQAELDIETMNKVADAVHEIQQKRAKEDLDFRAQQFEAQREQQNAAKAEELDALDQFFNDAQDAEDRYWENITAMAVAADELQAERVKDRISEIGDAFEYLGQAALEGGEAFERALANMARSLAVSGLRSILEGFLTSRVGGGGLFANLISPRASGGPVQAGRPYLVGEQRPELFVPNTSGTIIPRIPNMTANDKAWGGMSITLQQNMTLAANGDAQVARIAEDAASRGAAVAIKTIQRQFPALMIKSQRDRL